MKYKRDLNEENGNDFSVKRVPPFCSCNYYNWFIRAHTNNCYIYIYMKLLWYLRILIIFYWRIQYYCSGFHRFLRARKREVSISGRGTTARELAITRIYRFSTLWNFPPERNPNTPFFFFFLSLSLFWTRARHFNYYYYFMGPIK